MNVLIMQTAFLGDVILTLPLAQILKARFPHASVDMVVAPRAAGVLRGHPALGRVIVYDKHGTDSGIGGFVRLTNELRKGSYDTAFLPHRSLRSALAVARSGVRQRVGFDRSVASWLYTSRIPYSSDAHEVDRNLSLLLGIGEPVPPKPRPVLAPPAEDREAADAFLDHAGFAHRSYVTMAPGSVWMTKRWPEARYAELATSLVGHGMGVVVIGGPEDERICEEVVRLSGRRPDVVSAAGKMSILSSAELIRRSECLVTNDSAPLHIGVAMGTPVVAIFGATVPAFGFGPYGTEDRVIETDGLQCRPCAIHGGNACPIGTFECMLKIEPARVAAAVTRAARRHD